MDIRELFEQQYADRFDMTPAEVKAARLGDDSYNSLTIARCFRFFCAGFRANDSGKLRVIGYISNKSAENAYASSTIFIAQKPTKTTCCALLVKDGGGQ
jgi:hypothetical protein